MMVMHGGRGDNDVDDDDDDDDHYHHQLSCWPRQRSGTQSRLLIMLPYCFQK